MDRRKPTLLITLGDVAGVGPEIVVRGWADLVTVCRPVVVGDADWLRRAAKLVESSATVQTVSDPEHAEPTADHIPCLSGSGQDLSGVVPGKVSAAAGQAAFDYLCRAIDLTLAK